MFRAFFIFLSKANWAQNFIMNWNFAWKVASRFIAGINILDVIEVVKNLNESGFTATIDHLGENSSSKEDTISATNEVINLLDEINRSGVNANVSIKLSQFGLNIDKKLCIENVDRILQKAIEVNNFIRIDMEDSSITQDTLEIVRLAKQKYSGIGTVIQSYLYRSLADVEKLTDECIPIRMVK